MASHNTGLLPQAFYMDKYTTEPQYFAFRINKITAEIKTIGTGNIAEIERAVRSSIKAENLHHPGKNYFRVDDIFGGIKKGSTKAVGKFCVDKGTDDFIYYVSPIRNEESDYGVIYFEKSYEHSPLGEITCNFAGDCKTEQTADLLAQTIMFQHLKKRELIERTDGNEETSNGKIYQYDSYKAMEEAGNVQFFVKVVIVRL